MPSAHADTKPARAIHKYWTYAFVVAVSVLLLSVAGVVNAYLHFATQASYSVALVHDSTYLLIAGYLGIFLTILFSPVPDYLLLPVYGYLCAAGLFNPLDVFLVCMVGAVIPIEYVCGRFAARPLLMKGLSYFRISEGTIKDADAWLEEHGKFSIFISTFIPFFYSVSSLAAGTLRMGALAFLLDSTLGFGVRYAVLEYLGYYSVYLFTASFDYSHRDLLAVLAVASCAYALAYLVRRNRGPSAENVQ